MGLDVIAHKRLKKSDINNEESFLAFVITDEWLNRISTLENNEYYTSEDRASFVGYSYSQHGRLRREVCKIMGLKGEEWINDELKPGSDFEEWLNFADNEGVIDCKTSKKLLYDFRKWETIAEEKLSEYDYQCYMNWIKTFEFASENGAVQYN